GRDERLARRPAGSHEHHIGERRGHDGGCRRDDLRVEVAVFDRESAEELRRRRRVVDLEPLRLRLRSGRLEHHLGDGQIAGTGRHRRHLRGRRRCGRIGVGIRVVAGRFGIVSAVAIATADGRLARRPTRGRRGQSASRGGGGGRAAGGGGGGGPAPGGGGGGGGGAGGARG